MALPSSHRRRLRILSVLSAGVLQAFLPTGFLGGSPLPSRLSAAGRSALPWDAEGAKRGELAYAAFTAEFPKMAQTADKCDKGSVISRYESLAGLVGPEIALEMVEKEPILSCWDATQVAKSYKWLVSKEEAGVPSAREIVRMNPKLLTIADFEYERTKPSLDSLATAASGIDALRPLGPFGPFIGITAIFISGLVVLRLISNALRPVFEEVGASISQTVPTLKPFDAVRMAADSFFPSS